MTKRALLLLTAIGVAAVAGCYTGPSSELSPANPGPGVATDGTEPKLGADGKPVDGSPAAADGLPCDVAKVLASSCTDCHGARPTNGAPSSLVTYEDVTARSKDDPSETVAQASLDRMKATKKPMPPDGKISAADIAVFEKWVGAGMPRGACGGKTTTASADGGSDGAALPTDAGKQSDAAVVTPTVCTSGVTWAQAAPPTALMHPGKDCIACHSAMGAPAFVLAGTVYPTLHEPNDCNGAGGGNLSVVIVDAAGKSHTMPVNAAGNFMRVTALPMPYRAMVVSGTKVREMKTPQTDGDCNGCHSEQGSHSPGRIMAP